MTTTPPELICDFCYIPDVRWQYHTHEFGLTGDDSVFGDTPVQEIEGVSYVSFDDLHPHKTGPTAILGKDWLLCERCADCIEHRRADSLSERLLAACLNRMAPEPCSYPETLREHLQMFCQAFLHQQTTPRSPWPPVPPAPSESGS